MDYLTLYPPRLYALPFFRSLLEEESLTREDDPEERLERLPSHMAYWFGWYSFHPATDVYAVLE